MKKQVLIIAIILSAAVALILALRPRAEPRYQNKPLSEWLERLRINQNDPEALIAVRSIGTNAIPYLLERVRYRPWQVRVSFATTANKLLAALAFRNRHFVDASLLRGAQGAVGFIALGSVASNAVPALGSLLKEPDPVGSTAAWALSGIGSPALPEFIKALQDGPATAVMNAQWVSLLATNAAPAVPLLLAWLDDTNLEVRIRCTGTLAQLRLDPVHVVPVLIKALNDPHPAVRAPAAFGLGRFGEQAQSAVSALTSRLIDSDPSVRFQATNALQKIQPGSFPKSSP